MTAIPNTWHLRAVADAAGKPCWIDYKITTAVLITPDNKDFFYICRGHLKDRNFATAATPTEDADAKAKKREEELQREIEAIKKEYAEKQAKKKSKDKDKDKSKDDKAKEDDTKDEKEKDDKIKAAKDKADTSPDASSDTSELPRIWSLHRNFYQMRLERIRKAEIARRNRERLNDPNAFPSVPSGLP